MTEEQKAESFNKYFDHCMDVETEILIDIGISLHLEQRIENTDRVWSVMYL